MVVNMLPQKAMEQKQKVKVEEEEEESEEDEQTPVSRPEPVPAPIVQKRIVHRMSKGERDAYYSTNELSNFSKEEDQAIKL